MKSYTSAIVFTTAAVSLAVMLAPTMVRLTGQLPPPAFVPTTLLPSVPPPPVVATLAAAKVRIHCCTKANTCSTKLVGANEVCPSGQKTFATEAACMSACGEMPTVSSEPADTPEKPVYCCRKSGTTYSCDGVEPASPRGDSCEGRTVFADAASCLASCNVPVNPPPKPLSCFVCQYAGLIYDGKPHCAQATDESSCRTLRIPDGTKTKDCSWRDGACISRFESDCRDRAAKAKADKIIYLEENDDVWSLNLSACTSVEYLFRGHSSEDMCSHHVGSVSACVEKAPNCTKFNAAIEGCLTFKNHDAAVEHANKIRQYLPPGATLTITGNQTVSRPNICTTSLKLAVTCDGVGKEFYDCHKPGEACFGRFGEETSTCRGPDGKEAIEICCLDDKWYAGKTCPDKVDRIMEEDHHITGDKCDAWAQGKTCAAAAEEAKKEAMACVDRAKTWCAEHKGTFVPKDCVTRDSVPPTAAPRCEQKVFCPWSCLGVVSDRLR
jgi:hypothetical protein